MTTYSKSLIHATSVNRLNELSLTERYPISMDYARLVISKLGERKQYAAGVCTWHGQFFLAVSGEAILESHETPFNLMTYEDGRAVIEIPAMNREAEELMDRCIGDLIAEEESKPQVTLRIVPQA